MFIKSEVTDTIINSDAIHAIRVVSSYDEDCKPCFKVVAVMSNTNMILYIRKNRVEAIHMLNALWRMLSKSVRRDISSAE